MLVRVDLHSHALGDGRYGSRTPDLVAAHLDGALEAGLHCIGVTDHDDLRPGLLAEEYALKANLPILVIAGMEITTEEGHLVALGLRNPVPSWRSMTETIEQIRHQEAISILPHPFFPALRARRDVDAMERLNYRYGDFDVDRDDIAVIASSDAHAPSDLRDSPHYTLLHVEHLSREEVASAIRARRASIAFRRPVDESDRGEEVGAP